MADGDQRHVRDAICAIEIGRDGRGGLRVCVRGDVDRTSAPTLDTVLADCLPAAVPVSIDLSGVTFIDRHGLDTLLALRRRAPGLVRIAATSRCVERLVEVTHAVELTPLRTVA